MTTEAFASPPCPVCIRASVIHLDRKDVERYQAGEHVQDVWPDKTDDERELIITGTHPECWAQMFPDEDDDDD